MMPAMPVQAPCHRFSRLFISGGGWVGRRYAEAGKIGGWQRGVGIVVVFGSQHRHLACCYWSAVVADSCPQEEWIVNRKFLKKKKKLM
jgi:hypothetical protein